MFLLVKVSLLGTGWAIVARPMIDKENNFLMIMNEFVILVTSYLVLLFSDFVPQPEDQYQFGYMYITLFLFESAINVVIFLVITIKEIIAYCKRRRLKKLVINKKVD